jgi:hypothetical protein
VLVTWTADGFPQPANHPPLGGVSGKLVRLSSGWLEKVSTGGSSACSGLDSSKSITADFAQPTSHGYWFEMRACMRSPDVVLHTQQVLAMLRDARFVALPHCATYYAKPQPSTIPGVAPGIHAGPLQINLTPLRQGYPTKVLISARHPIRSPITLTGIGCDTGTPLHFAFSTSPTETAISGTPPFTITTLERTGEPSVVIGPSTRAPTERTGYILFPTRNGYRIDLHQNGRIIRSVTVYEPAHAS